MAQARRKPPARSTHGRARRASKNRARSAWPAVGLLVGGMVIGALATMLWQGARGEYGIGAGLGQMFARSAAPPAPANSQTHAPPAPPSTDFTFFTVLPEIEVVAPQTAAAGARAEPPRASEAAPDSSAQNRQVQPSPVKSSPVKSSYMLQAGSYPRRADADHLKATLALRGIVSAIQKVSIQGKGDFYRVRLGPYSTYQAMEQADESLRQAGIKTLRLKMVPPNQSN